MLIEIKGFFPVNIFRCSLDGVYAFLGVLLIRSKSWSRVTSPTISLIRSLSSGVRSSRMGPLLSWTRVGISEEMKSLANSPRMPPPIRFSKLACRHRKNNNNTFDVSTVNFNLKNQRM